MWWLIGLLAALAAAKSSSVVTDSSAATGATACTLTYRSRDGSSFFRFRFAPICGGIRIYILACPQSRTASCHVRLDDRGQPYICWSQAIRSMRKAEAVAAIWAEATLVYQRTGRTF